VALSSVSTGTFFFKFLLLKEPWLIRNMTARIKPSIEDNNNNNKANSTSLFIVVLTQQTKGQLQSKKEER
jgi:hypothetical protein